MAIFSNFLFGRKLTVRKQPHAQKVLNNIPVSNFDKFFCLISDKVSEIIDFDGLCNSNIRRVINY